MCPFLKLLMNMALTSKCAKANLTAISHGPAISNLPTTKTGNYIFKNQLTYEYQCPQPCLLKYKFSYVKTTAKWNCCETHRFSAKDSIFRVWMDTKARINCVDNINLILTTASYQTHHQILPSPKDKADFDKSINKQCLLWKICPYFHLD